MFFSPTKKRVVGTNGGYTDQGNTESPNPTGQGEEQTFGTASKKVVSKFSNTKKVAKDDYFGTKRPTD